MAQKKIIFVIFLMLFTRTAMSQILCTGDTKHNSLSYRDTEKNLWDLTQFEFSKTSFTASYLACSKYFEQLSSKNRNQVNSHTFKALYPFENRTLRFKYKQDENEVYMAKCNETPGCKLTFFQNIFNPSLLFKNKIKKDVFADMPYCKHLFKSTDTPLISETEVWNNTRISPIEIWNLPDQALDKNLFAFLDNFQPEQIYLSTMIPSLAILKRLDLWLLKNPASKATVLFSYNLASLDDDFPTDYNFVSKRLNVIPVFQTPDTPTTYHIKGGVFIKKDQIQSLLYSVNLRRFREEKVADLAFLSNEKDLSYSLLSRFKNVIQFQCKNIKWLKCSQRLRYFDSDKRKRKIDAFFKLNCKEEYLLNTSIPAHTNVIMSGSENLPTFLIKAIDSAQSEILISSHVYGFSLFHEAVLRAKARGVVVKFLLGTEIDKPELSSYLKNNFNVKVFDRKSGFTSHAKFLIIDDRDVVWATGNFTKTSMSNPFDIYIKSDDDEFKQGLKKYFYNFFKPTN